MRNNLLKTICLDNKSGNFWDGCYNMDTKQFELYVPAKAIDSISTEVTIIEEGTQWRCWLKRVTYDNGTGLYQVIYKDY